MIYNLSIAVKRKIAFNLDNMHICFYVHLYIMTDITRTVYIIFVIYPFIKNAETKLGISRYQCETPNYILVGASIPASAKPVLITVLTAAQSFRLAFVDC